MILRYVTVDLARLMLNLARLRVDLARLRVSLARLRGNLARLPNGGATEFFRFSKNVDSDRDLGPTEGQLTPDGGPTKITPNVHCPLRDGLRWDSVGLQARLRWPSTGPSF